MYGDARQPSRKRRAAGKLIEMLISTHVGVLHYVFRFVVVAKNSARHSIQALVVAPHNDFVERGFSRANSVDDLFVGPALRSRFLQNFCYFHIFRNYRVGKSKRVTAYFLLPPAQIIVTKRRFGAL